MWIAERTSPATDRRRSIYTRRRRHPATGRRIGSVTVTNTIGCAALRVAGVVALTISLACGAAEPPPDIGTTLRELEQKRPAVPPKPDPSLQVDKSSRPALEAGAATKFAVSSVRISGATAFSDLELLPLDRRRRRTPGHSGRPAGRGGTYHQVLSRQRIPSGARLRACAEHRSRWRRNRGARRPLRATRCAQSEQALREPGARYVARACHRQRHRNGAARSRTAVAQRSLRCCSGGHADAGAARGHGRSDRERIHRRRRTAARSKRTTTATGTPAKVAMAAALPRRTSRGAAIC